MCGIAGYYSFKQSSFTHEELLAMTGRLKHRGPDAQGTFVDEVAGFGNTRLSILDLTSKANQPIFSSSGRYVMVYNGEIFNAIDLAKALHIPLKSKGDTEAVLALFECIGTKMGEMLNGMFVIVIYDLQRKELHIFRDRMGVKPLYYYLDDNYFVFGSEVKSLLELPYIKEKVKVSEEAISFFLHLGFIPGSSTIYNQIKKFPSGHYLKLSKHDQVILPFWKPEDTINKEIISDLSEAKKELKKRLENSVATHLMSDVPLGVFFSGGIDSSLVTAMAIKVSGKPVQTFTARLDEPLYDESLYARRIADYLGTEHHEVTISEREIISSWEELLDHFDGPFGDSSCFPTYLLSKFARSKVKVVLTGEGSDELFMGYGAYNWAKRLDSGFLNIFKKPIGSILRIGNNRAKRASHMFEMVEQSKMRSHIHSQEQYLFSEKEISRLLLPGCSGPLSLPSLSNTARVLSPIEEQALFDLKYYLKDGLLHKMDIASMKCSLEARVPFLDSGVVDYALNLSEKLKINKKENKFLLKEILYELVPRKYFNRPKKGFSIPLSSWLKNDLRFLLEDLLSKEKIEATGFLNYTQVSELKNRFLSGKENYLFNRIYVMLVLQRWLLKNHYGA